MCHLMRFFSEPGRMVENLLRMVEVPSHTCRRLAFALSDRPCADGSSQAPENNRFDPRRQREPHRLGDSPSMGGGRANSFRAGCRRRSGDLPVSISSQSASGDVAGALLVPVYSKRRSQKGRGCLTAVAPRSIGPGRTIDSSAGPHADPRPPSRMARRPSYSQRAAGNNPRPVDRMGCAAALSPIARKLRTLILVGGLHPDPRPSDIGRQFDGESPPARCRHGRASTSSGAGRMRQGACGTD